MVVTGAFGGMHDVILAVEIFEGELRLGGARVVGVKCSEKLLGSDAEYAKLAVIDRGQIQSPDRSAAGELTRQHVPVPRGEDASDRSGNLLLYSSNYKEGSGVKQHWISGAAIVAVSMACAVLPSFSETVVPIQGIGAKPAYPEWYLQGTSADPEGPLPMDMLLGRGELGNSTRVRLGQGKEPLPRQGFGSGVASDNNPPACAKSPICGFDGSILGGVTDGIERVVWKPTMGYTFSYPIDLPTGGGNVGAASVDSKDNIWVWQRNNGNVPALFKFGPDNKLLFAVDPKLTDHNAPFRAHSMKVDTDDNAWTVDQSGSVVHKFGPDGKLLQTIGIKGKRGDWDESKGQRLLWEPVGIDFGPTGDVYIFCSHGDESPNDFASGDPTNQLGVARVIHLDKTGKFVNQWFGPDHGPGKFYNAHGSAVDPVTGDVWVGDRQDYRIQIFTANGHFLRTIAMRNLTSAMFFDKRKGPTFGQLWMADGQDGQVLKLDRNGNVMRGNRHA